MTDAIDRLTSYYAATANAAPERTTLDGEARADVCVVGGGFTGISAALNLAERGYDVVVLEAERVGWGASGRNGGQAGSAYAADMSAIRRWVGEEDAKRLWAIAEESKAIIRERVARHGIQCDLRDGQFHAANKPRHLRDLRQMQADWAQTYGYTDTELVDRDGLGRHVATDAYVGGLYDSGSLHLHPLNYCLGLARAAEEAGARIFEGSRVESLTYGEPAVVHTTDGCVRADHVILCANAYLGELVPAVRRAIMPVGTYMGATPPLGRERALALLPSNAGVTDSNFVLDYFRLSADWRLLYGGRVSYSTIPPRDLAASLGARMRHVFPSLSDVGFEYTWGGYVAITAERTPDLGRVTGNVLCCQGFSGHGVALTGVAGKLAAEAVAGQAERFDVMARLPHTPFPGGRRLRTPLLVAAMAYYRLRDLLP
ncbi:gamma-glutamylputrescine oxidase [Limimonas halophila]|uniref:Gamma-glutamylputrescine oxidase n=1 Tax=Limimonas halophila TaxID=1082479 RepID=A0A1G7QZJ5_9PROT|nr:FAD-binding oxidoreductase [Limimonas halophila]SDG03309.1 gamma-glutamylputrescine oxidase [Limimonas halophila]